MPVIPPQEQWNAYIKAFNTADPEERATLLHQSAADGVIFTNPGGSGSTRAALSAHIAEFRTKMPGAYFGTDKTLVTQDELLAVWSMYKGDGTKLATGYNFVQFDQAGTLAYMAGFF
jgi:hypothetical protein